MAGYVVVPQYIVDAIGPRLSSNENTGRTIAEQLARTDSTGTLLQKMVAGEELTAVEVAQLPPLMRGNTWQEVADDLQERVLKSNA